MADLDFKHNVSQIPAGADLPKPVERRVSAETTGTPDYQSAAQQYAASTNWMSKLGSEVAVRASNAIATKLGGEAGKNPTGDIGIPLTDFDKAFQESYRVQSSATLGIQADKLITDSNLEMAKAVRITPDLIAKTNNQISLGLQNIFKNAPIETRPQLESQYQAQQIAQVKMLTERMITEQKEDRKNTMVVSTKQNTESAYSLELHGIDVDKNGDSKAAMAAVSAVEKGTASSVNMRDLSPQDRLAAVDAARQSRLSGKITRMGIQAEKDGKLGAFQKDLADNPEKLGISPKDHAPVLNNFMAYMNNQQALRAGQENLVSQNMYNRIAENPRAISTSDFESQVSPLKASQMKFHLIQAMNKKSGNEQAVNDLMRNYGDSRAQAAAKPEVKDTVFLKGVSQTMQSDGSLSLAQAENRVAATAGAPPPIFTKGLHNGLWSGDAAQMLERARQIDDLQGNGNGHALNDLSEQDKALASDIAHNANPQDPAWAARMIAENRENQDPKIVKISQEALNNKIFNEATKTNTNLDDWVLGQFKLLPGMFHDGFDSPWLKSAYGADILSVYSANWINTRGDEGRTRDLTQKYIDNNYDITYINGEKQLGKHPLEKAVGFNPGEGLPSIYKDVIRQTAGPMSKLKEAYDAKKSDEYWSIETVKTGSKLKSDFGQPSMQDINSLVFVKHSRNGVSTDVKKYPLKLVGNSFNWELNIQTETATRSVFLEAPAIGVHRYTPDKQWIQDDHMGIPHVKENDKYQGMVNQLLAIPDSEVKNG